MSRILRFQRRASSSEFENLLRPHVEYLYRLAYRFTGGAADAEDLVQDVLVKLYPRCAELAKVEQLRPWLARVLYRQFVDAVRRQARAPVVDPVSGADGDDPMDQFPAEQEGPEEQAARNLSHPHILRALMQLNAEQRAVLTLHDVEGYSLEELEPILDVPLGTLKSRLHRARQRLRGLLSMEPFAGAERVGGEDQ